MDWTSCPDIGLLEFSLIKFLSSNKKKYKKNRTKTIEDNFLLARGLNDRYDYMRNPVNTHTELNITGHLT